MNSDSRWYRASKAKVVCIRRTNHDASQWEILLNTQLLCGGFSSAEEAALAANKKDFDNDYATGIFNGTYVPSDINMWQMNQPDDFPSDNEYNNEDEATDCKSRFRNSSFSRLDYD